jgi:hypothetical protein
LGGTAKQSPRPRQEGCFLFSKKAMKETLNIKRYLKENWVKAENP